MSRRQVIVVGAGPAGLMAAGQAAQAGADTLLLEKTNRPGRKLGVAGKGRCNLTNVAPIEEFVAHFGPNGRFLRQAFSTFFTPHLLALLVERGVRTVEETGGRVFPASGRAGHVVDALVGWVSEHGVAISTRSAVRSLIIGRSRVVGVRVSHGRAQYGDSVVLAMGGASYPATGWAPPLKMVHS